MKMHMSVSAKTEEMRQKLTIYLTGKAQKHSQLSTAARRVLLHQVRTAPKGHASADIITLRP